MEVAFTVSGKVQGVGFRYITKMLADKYNVFGIVKNLDNGDVYIEAVGDTNNVNSFIEEIKSSPAPFGRVDYIDFKSLSNFQDYTKFSITY